LQKKEKKVRIARDKFMDIQEKLQDIIRNGIDMDIYKAEQSYLVLSEIGNYSKIINEKTFGEFFGTIQYILQDYFILSVIKLFEKPTSRYELKTIPAAINILSKYSDILKIKDRLNMINRMVKFGIKQDDLEHLNEQEITLKVANIFIEKSPTNPDSELSNAYKALQILRDKVIAHHEAIELPDFLNITWTEASKLIEFAKSFVSIIEMGYFNIIYNIR
jgi:hypothetical protein